MKILLDPNIAVLIKDMSDAECAEILRCIFEYPNRDCEIGLWKYIKTQIDRDAQKYKEKCDRALALVEKRKETDTKSSTKSSSISCMKSSVIVSSKEKDIDKNIDIEKEKSFAELFDKEYDLLKEIIYEIIPHASEYYVGIIPDIEEYLGYLEKNLGNDF